jgi:homoserine O-succinyltransferase
MSLLVGRALGRNDDVIDLCRAGSRDLRVALVNNMPDAALGATERQFLALLQSASRNMTVEVEFFSLPEIDRSQAVRTDMRARYRPLDDLWDNPPDALIVTGTEPVASDLRDEPYWDSLVRLLTWAEGSTGTTILSCLAAHAAVLMFEGIERLPLPQKCSGVFANEVAARDPLVRSMGRRVAFPHSRYNDVPQEAIEAHGYTALLRSPEVGWTVAVKSRGACLFVLMQGHPEYESDTLLREYRRDVRRYLDGQRRTYPVIPAGYLSNDHTALLRDFETRARDEAHGEVRTRPFPYEQLEMGLTKGWASSALVLYSNWLREAHRRSEPRYSRADRPMAQMLRSSPARD